MSLPHCHRFPSLRPGGGLALFLILSMVVGLATTSHAASISAGWELLVKGSRYHNFGGATGPAPYRGQIFTATESGPLSAVVLRIGQVGDPPVDMRIEVRSVGWGSGLPAPTALDAVDVPGADLPSALPSYTADDVYRFDFSSSVLLEAGQLYAIVAYPVPLHPSGDPFFLNGEEGPTATYDGGSAISSTNGTQWQAYPGVDYGFRVIVGTGVSTADSSWGRIKLLY